MGNLHRYGPAKDSSHFYFFNFFIFPAFIFLLFGRRRGGDLSAGTWNGRSSSNLLSAVDDSRRKKKQFFLLTFGVSFSFPVWSLVFIWANGYSHSPLPCHCYLGMFGSVFGRAGVQQHTQRLEPRGDGRRTDNKMIPSTTPVNCRSDLGGGVLIVSYRLRLYHFRIYNVSLFLFFFLSLFGFFGQLLCLYGSRCCCSAKINTAGNTAICLRH